MQRGKNRNSVGDLGVRQL